MKLTVSDRIVSEIDKNTLRAFSGQVLEGLLYNKTIEHKNRGGQFLGWIDNIGSEIDKVKELSERIKQQSEILVVIGIGGSYLGAKAVIDALKSTYEDPKVIFAGTSLSSKDLKELLAYLENKEFSVSVVSKSGSTIETNLIFRYLKELLIEKYEDEYKERIYVTTGMQGGLRNLIEEEGLENQSLSIPTDIGGRFSIFTSANLLPIAFQGLNIDEFLLGAKSAMNECLGLKDNLALDYATMRNLYYTRGKKIELLVTYEERLESLTNWYKQLFGESEGKNGKGLFPASSVFTRDLHSLGQLIQEGERNIFETVLTFQEDLELAIPGAINNYDGLNSLEGISLKEIARCAKEGATKAHKSGGVPVIELTMGPLNEYNLGYLMYFFLISCTISATALGVNPFDQPGVEMYKQNMMNLLEFM